MDSKWEAHLVGFQARVELFPLLSKLDVDKSAMSSLVVVSVWEVRRDLGRSAGDGHRSGRKDVGVRRRRVESAVEDASDTTMRVGRGWKYFFLNGKIQLGKNGWGKREAERRKAISPASATRASRKAEADQSITGSTNSRSHVHRILSQHGHSAHL